MLLNRAGACARRSSTSRSGSPSVSRSCAPSVCGGLRALARLVCGRARLQRVRGGRAPRRGWSPTASRRGSSSSRSASTSARSRRRLDSLRRRRLGRRRSASRRRAPRSRSRRSCPSRSFRLVTTRGPRARSRHAPPNVEVETDLPFDEMRRRLEEARVVALPVLDNSYSGATTVLLQAMALAKPVVVSRTKAIASGYGLVDGENCRLVEPGDAHAFQRALGDVLRDEWHARALGAQRARDGGGGPHVGSLRRPDRGGSSRRMRSTAGCALSTRVRPASSRCAASSAASARSPTDASRRRPRRYAVPRTAAATRGSPSTRRPRCSPSRRAVARAVADGSASTSASASTSRD